MKTIKYIFAIICLFSFVGGVFSSCTDEIEKKDNAGTGIANSLQLQLTIPDNEEIAPMTKSDQSESEGINDLSILIYKVDDSSLAEHFYYSKDQLQGLTTDGKYIKIGLTQIASGQKRVYLIANIGNESAYNTLCGQVETENDLKAYSVGLNGTKPAMLLAAQGNQDFDAQTGAQVSASLKRIYSMITVRVVRNLSNGLVIKPKSVQLKHVPTTGFLFKDNKIENDNQCKIDGEIIERASGATDFLTGEHTTAPALYMFENRQPVGSNGGDQTTKTPEGLKPGDIIETIKTDRKCSYIEVTADYLKNGQSGIAGSGTITYRFFLGKDALKNFDVERNVHYLVTLTLNGDGGKDEVTWRVETDLMKDLTVPDVYIGYRLGSETVVKAVGDLSTIENVSVASGFENKIEIVSRNAETGEIVLRAKESNTHDYRNSTYYLSYTIEGKTKQSKVIQVPRLVDPIAIYKNAQNITEEDITVRAFNGNSADPKYDVLQSVGPWKATIHSSSTSECWFEISTQDGSSRVLKVGDYITGEGPVKFKYKPLTPNTALDRLSGATLESEENDKARYGVILVEYHNERCPHEIFLRQGYQPTTINGSVWSMFNCIGLNSNNESVITEYPTETGWLFKGGYNYGLCPYDPGYGRNNEKIQLSNGSSEYFLKIPSDYETWIPSHATIPNRNNPSKGPCPTGYKLASGNDFDKLADNSTVMYTGFVYDDDPVKGWEYDSDGNARLIPGSGNHCNPAKGTLFVSKGDDKANIFFTYGKGIMTQHPNDGDVYVDEIGVGHRGLTSEQANVQGTKGFNYSKGYGGALFFSEFLGNNHKYGAYYWGASLFNREPSKATARFSRVTLEYDLLRSVEPAHVDVANSSNVADDSYGINGYWHASFVRCIRTESGSGGGETTVTIEPKATFKYGSLRRNISGTIIVSYSGGSQNLSVDGGKATSELKLPSNVTSVDLTYKKGYTYKTKASMSDLESSKSIILTAQEQ
ncbi:DUF4906 domain-containing protein [uncultured Parabacteroides sp.]|uniref:DUF4906 domain-containing protein n=1 Tax=uncultured Parabacteroides sp. TaxID=512312 RepID=UPI0025CFBE61|nr:DUF4906 domain-containing protein [uncultured Parabacteroides sp.]